MGTQELSLIDSSIKDMKTLSFPANLHTLNLHYNQIQRIENLESVRNLKHLDLSSNYVSSMNGLSCLFNLHTLNLSSNQISRVEGLQKLQKLRKLILSYNSIMSLDGFQALLGPSYQLEHLELQGNSVSSVEHVQACLVGCTQLRHVVFSKDSSDNPFCRYQSYRNTILSELPQIQVLDGIDRRGQEVSSDFSVADIPGFEEYADLLGAKGFSFPGKSLPGFKDSADVQVSTPAIDAVLQSFKSRGQVSESRSTDVSSSGTPQRTAGRQAQLHTKEQSDSSQNDRLQKLEDQIAALMAETQKKKEYSSYNVTPTPGSHKSFDKEDYEDSDGSNGPERNHKKQNHGATSSRIPQRKTKSAKYMNESTTGTEGQANASLSSEVGPSPEQKKTSKRVTSTRPKQADLRPKLSNRTRNIQSCSADERMRDNMKETYVEIMKELEIERERRWKAEQETRRLAEHLRHLQTKSQEDQAKQEKTFQATHRLKEIMSTEQEVKTRLQDQLLALQEDFGQVKEELMDCKEELDNKNKALDLMKEKLIQQQHEYHKVQTSEAKKLQESKLRGSAIHKELEIMKSQNKVLQDQVDQMKELLAVREQEHRNEMKNRHAIDSPQFQQLISREMERAEKVHVQEVELFKNRCSELQQQYEDLEDEFRLALHSESQRYCELESRFEEARQDLQEAEHQASQLKKRESTGTATVQELTALAKEQKGRLEEVQKAKQEQWIEHRERVASLEGRLEATTKKLKSFENVKKERAELEAQVQAQTSVIDGLKAERKLWSEELAQQGSSLAQDRGRLEAKIEGLTSDVRTLKLHLDKETDIVRIKCKIIEDQTESIQKLKQGVTERDEEVKRLRAELLKVQEQAQEQVSAEINNSQELQEKLDRARERKDELKTQLAQAEERLEEREQAYESICDKWNRKTSAIGELERQVQQMKSNWENKEKKVTEERDKALEAARIAVEKLRTMDDAFRDQLDTQEESHQKVMKKVEREKEEEIQLANKRVLEVEEEMRLLLYETDQQKRQMEDRFKKLSVVMGELQQGIF